MTFDEFELLKKVVNLLNVIDDPEDMFDLKDWKEAKLILNGLIKSQGDLPE